MSGTRQIRKGHGSVGVRATVAPSEHKWFTYRGLEACKRCGYVRRADDKNAPCKDVTNVKVRS